MKKKLETRFVLDFVNNDYPYLEEVNEGIVKQVKSTESEASILDVGAGRGALGAALCALGYEVWAIESNRIAASEVSDKVNQVICADLHDMNKIHECVKNKKFNYIVFSDVLEHVYDPLHVLRSYLPLLEDSGKILISLPNAVNWLNRLRFMLGMFNYEMTGVMDRTHVRFFTFKSAKKMLEAAECKVIKVDSTPFITRAFLPIIKKILSNKNDMTNVKTIIDSPYYQLYIKYIYPIEYAITRIMPSLFAFRIILVCEKNK
ncbi:MAG: class I SAM-dependent methyltransferase [Gammaproteobacteria bacterium]|nr:class I SAM-dependent methyltransferase [Gammaproteobacteria bacterium]